ncbi:serine/threonine protein kinase [Pumilibacter intestinalis]|uniref:serine/threonine protein kinase n=1 Tax=Pumilibacter intestinalis TaxID=2941511 RepID=UPI00203A8C87|nr:serine/threonine-protein kinase [Pumilibacter intestinalis]
MVRTSKNVCLNCFGTLDSQRVCLSCKKKADDSPSPPHHLPQRTVLNEKYLIYRALGEGGFGITYLAWDISCGLKVAIKEYYPSGYVNRMPRSNQVIINSKQNQAASNRGLKRFIEEAKILAKIKNLPGIVSVRDFFSANGTAYIVMEYLDGISLKKYLQRKGGKVPCDEILAILRPVMDSLISVHKCGLVHRDISPDNIIVTKKNEVKLIDFGAAKQSNLNGKSLSIVLKQGFAPEEQYRTHGEQGPWTDIYAIGVTIYYAITGSLPPESIQRLYKDTIIRPSEKGATISPTQESALMKSLAVYARHRYQDVTQMITGLYGRKSSGTSATAAAARKSFTADVSVDPAETGLSRSQSARLSKPAAPAFSRPALQIRTPQTSAAQPARAPQYSQPAIRQQPTAKPAQERNAPAQERSAPANQPTRTVTVTREHKPSLMEKLFGKKKK